MNDTSPTRPLARPSTIPTVRPRTPPAPGRGMRRALPRVAALCRRVQHGLDGGFPRQAVACAALLATGVVALVFVACTPQVNAELQATAGVNAVRVQAGLPPLTPDHQLVEVARLRSTDMAAKGYFSHDPPDGCNYVCLMGRNGVRYVYAAENIAWNDWPWDQSADVAVRMWHNSPPHLANILNCHFTRFGAGVARAADGKIYYTMIFEGDRAC